MILKLFIIIINFYRIEIKYFVSIDWFNLIENDFKKKIIRKKFLSFIFGKIDIFSSTNNKWNSLIFDWIQINDR